MQNDRLDIFRRILLLMPRRSMVDLGAGHCKFSLLAHKMGFPVTAVDARNERVPASLPFPLIQQDVRDVDLSPYFIVCILGLLYHLPLADQEALLRKCKGKTVIVDTHCAGMCLVTEGEYRGYNFEEIDAPTSSYLNRFSFWHTEDSLLLLFRNHGFNAEKVEPEHAPLRAFWILTPNENT